MRALELRTVFTAGEVMDSSSGEVLTQPFEEIGEILSVPPRGRFSSL